MDQLSRIKDLVEEGNLDQARKHLDLFNTICPRVEKFILFKLLEDRRFKPYSCLSRWVMFSCLSFT